MPALTNQLKTIGELNDRIGIVTPTEVVDDYGGKRVTITGGSATIPAKVRYERTNEQDNLKQEKFTQEIKIHIRNGSYDELDYVYWNDKYWDVYAIESTPRERFMVIKARLIEQ